MTTLLILCQEHPQVYHRLTFYESQIRIHILPKLEGGVLFRSTRRTPPFELDPAAQYHSFSQHREGIAEAAAQDILVAEVWSWLVRRQQP